MTMEAAVLCTNILFECDAWYKPHKIDSLISRSCRMNIYLSIKGKATAVILTTLTTTYKRRSFKTGRHSATACHRKMSGECCAKVDGFSCFSPCYVVVYDDLDVLVGVNRCSVRVVAWRQSLGRNSQIVNCTINRVRPVQRCMPWWISVCENNYKALIQHRVAFQKDRRQLPHHTQQLLYDLISLRNKHWTYSFNANEFSFHLFGQTTVMENNVTMFPNFNALGYHHNIIAQRKIFQRILRSTQFHNKCKESFILEYYAHGTTASW